MHAAVADFPEAPPGQDGDGYDGEYGEGDGVVTLHGDARWVCIGRRVALFCRCSVLWFGGSCVDVAVESCFGVQSKVSAENFIDTVAL